jgi:hypothetical protein
MSMQITNKFRPRIFTEPGSADSKESAIKRAGWAGLIARILLFNKPGSVISNCYSQSRAKLFRTCPRLKSFWTCISRKLITAITRKLVKTTSHSKGACGQLQTLLTDEQSFFSCPHAPFQILTHI